MSDDLQPLNWLLNSKCPDINYAESNKPKSTSKKSLDYILRNARNVLEECRTTPTIRPPLSYATLILLSLNSAPGKTLTLSQIYKWIRSTFKYYENTTGAKATQWKNSIRHNLSLNKCFVKVPRAEGERGKGGFWTLDKQCERKLVNGENFYRLRKRRKTKVASICREEVISTDGQECLGVVDWSGGEATHQHPQEQNPPNSSPDTEQHDSSSAHSEVHSMVGVTEAEPIPGMDSYPVANEFNQAAFQMAIPLDEISQSQFGPSSSPDPISGVVHLQEMTAVEPLLGTTVIPLESLAEDAPEGQETTPYYELLPVEWTFELYGDPKGACFDFPGLELDLEAWIG